MMMPPDLYCRDRPGTVLRCAGLGFGKAAVAVHRLAQLSDLKLSFCVEAEPRAVASRVGLGGPSPVFQKLLAESGFPTLMAPPTVGDKLLPSSKRGGHRQREGNGFACIHQ